MKEAGEKNAIAPKVSVIILNLNGLGYLEDCLSSLAKQSFIDFEVIIVDNGSHDGSTDFIEKNYHGFAQMIKLSENIGYAGGNNVGIAAAKGLYIALLNNDTFVDAQWLDQMVYCIESDESIGMVGSKILNYYRRKEIDNTGHLIYPDGLNRGRGRLEIDHGQYDQQSEILFPSGCAALYKRKMLDEIGGFDIAFFAYGDDTDIGLHGRCLGYKALYCPKAIVYHKYSGTAGAYSALKAFYVERNRIWILIKYFPLKLILLSPYYTLKRIILHGYGIFAHRGAASRFAEQVSGMVLINTFLKAYLSALKGLPEIWEKRRNIQNNKLLSATEFEYLLRQHTISCREIALKD